MKRTTLRVYPIVDLAHLSTTTVEEVRRQIGAVLRGGATLIQFREKTDRFEDLAHVVAAVRPWLREAGVPFVINDLLELALVLAADGVHLGQHDMPLAEARTIARARGRGDLWIGVSVTTAAQCRRALENGATYLSVSPVFGTPTKPDIEKPVGLQGLRSLRAAAPDAPLVAIGGIRAGNAAAVAAAGADGVSFVSPLRRDPETAVREMATAVSAGLRLAKSEIMNDRAVRELSSQHSEGSELR
jgi:thiamine-phosphate pyrophosphorylase